MIGLTSDLLPCPKNPRRTRALRLPAALANSRYCLTWRKGVHIYGAGVRKSSWHDIKHRQGMVALFSGRTSGEARWIDHEGGHHVHPLRSGDVWFVAPEVSHSCVLHRKSDVVMIFLEPWRIEEAIEHLYWRVVGTGSVARLRAYFPVVPILRAIHRVVVDQINRASFSCEAEEPDRIDTALVFARHLWFFHYCGLRVYADGKGPDAVLAEL